MHKTIRSLSNPSFMIFVKDENNLHFLLKFLLFNQVIFPLKMIYFFTYSLVFGYIFLLRKKSEPFFLITLFWNYFKQELNYTLTSSLKKMKYNLIQKQREKQRFIINFFKYDLSNKEIRFLYKNYLKINIKNIEKHYKIIFREYFLEDVLFSRQYNFFNQIQNLYCMHLNLKFYAILTYNLIKNIIQSFFKKLINVIKILVRKFMPLIGMGILSEKIFFLLVFFLNPFLKFVFLNCKNFFKNKNNNKLQIQRKLDFIVVELVLKQHLLKCFNIYSKKFFFIKGKNLEQRRNKKFKKKLFFFKFFDCFKNLIVINIIFFNQAVLFFIFFLLSWFFTLYLDLALDCSLLSYELKKEGLNFLFDYFFGFIFKNFFEILLDFIKKYFIIFLMYKIIDELKKPKQSFHKTFFRKNSIEKENTLKILIKKKKNENS